MIHNKLIQIQAQLKAPKSQRNNFGNYNYRSCEDILGAAKPLLAESGVLLMITDEIVLKGERYYVKATASVTDGNGVVSVSAFARESNERKGMDGAQITGAASSYARKYALNGLFAIDDTKDSDHPTPPAPKKKRDIKGVKDLINGKKELSHTDFNKALDRYFEGEKDIFEKAQEKNFYMTQSQKMDLKAYEEGKRTRPVSATRFAAFEIAFKNEGDMDAFDNAEKMKYGFTVEQTEKIEQIISKV